MAQLNAKAVRSALTRYLKVYAHESLGSTNALAKEMAAGGKPGNFLLLANEQTNGRGRLGRSFYSPPDTGIYLSLVLHHVPLSNAVLLTTAASVAVAQAVEECLGCSLSIKWVNDLFLGDRKVAGILTELLSDGVVIGIGLNTAPSAFPSELRDVVGWVPLGEIPRERLIAAIVNRLFDFADALPDRSFLADYRARSMVLGKRIRCIRASTEFEATAVDIDDDGGLIVQFDDGTKRTLSSGEITIRPTNTGE